MWWQLAWWVVRHPKEAVAFYKRVRGLMLLTQSPLMDYVIRAVTKVSTDPSFHPSKDHALKRKEAIEWTAHYMRDAGLLDPKTPWPTWEVSFLVEWAVGTLKGKV